mgnify:CR=1 FL=1|jgi:hypothetical protein
MEIVPDLIKSNLSKNQVEYIQKKQHEYKLTNKKRRVPGTYFIFIQSENERDKESFYYQRSFNWIKRETYNEN